MKLQFKILGRVCVGHRVQASLSLLNLDYYSWQLDKGGFFLTFTYSSADQWHF